MANNEMNWLLIPGELSAPHKRTGLGHRARVDESIAFKRDLEVFGCAPSSQEETATPPVKPAAVAPR